MPPRWTAWDFDAVGLAVVAAAGYACAFVVATLAYVFVEPAQRKVAMDRYGNAITHDLAQLAVEPLKRQDRVAFGLLVERMSERDEVWRVAIYTADDRPFVVAGRSAGQGTPPYVRAVTAQNEVIGDVRVTLDGTRFGLSLPRLLARSWLFWLAGLLLTGAGCYCGAAVRRHRDKTPKAVPAASETSDKYIMVANLFRRVGMTTTERETAIRQASAWAEKVADLYAAETAALPGTGVALIFAASKSNRGVDAVCAALLARRLFENPTPDLGQASAARRPPSSPADDTSDERDDGRRSGGADEVAQSSLFRYGLELVTVAGRPSAAEAAHGVALLSSLAPNGEVIVGEAAYAVLETQEQVHLDRFETAASRALPPYVSAPTAIVRGVAESVEAHLQGQAESIGTAVGDALP